MSQKEASVHIVDVGVPMNEAHLGRAQSDFAWAIPCFWHQMFKAAASERKTLYHSVVGFRTSESNNPIVPNDPDYENISVILPLVSVTAEALSWVRSQLVPGQAYNGDILSALATSILLLSQRNFDTCRRRITILLNGRDTLVSNDGMDKITQKLHDDKIELLVYGIDFSKFSCQETCHNDDDLHDSSVECILRRICQGSGGHIYPISEVLANIEGIYNTPIKPVPSFRGILGLGDSKCVSRAIEIPVERYARCISHKALMMTSVISTNKLNETQDDAKGLKRSNDSSVKDHFLPVKYVNKHTVSGLMNDASTEEQEVHPSRLEPGFYFGKTIIPIADSQLHLIKLKNCSGIQIIGFISRDNLKCSMLISRASVIVAAPEDTRAALSLCSLVQAMIETEVFGVARYVSREDSPPVLIVLVPWIESGIASLIDFELPFADDIRLMEVDWQDNISAECSPVLQETINKYVDSMDISEQVETRFTEFHDPVRKRVNEAIKRVILEEKPLDIALKETIISKES